MTHPGKPTFDPCLGREHKYKDGVCTRCGANNFRDTAARLAESAAGRVAMTEALYYWNDGGIERVRAEMRE